MVRDSKVVLKRNVVFASNHRSSSLNWHGLDLRFSNYGSSFPYIMHEGRIIEGKKGVGEEVKYESLRTVGL